MARISSPRRAKSAERIEGAISFPAPGRTGRPHRATTSCTVWCRRTGNPSGGCCSRTVPEAPPAACAAGEADADPRVLEHRAGPGRLDPQQRRHHVDAIARSVGHEQVDRVALLAARAAGRTLCEHHVDGDVVGRRVGGIADAQAHLLEQQLRLADRLAHELRDLERGFGQADEHLDRPAGAGRRSCGRVLLEDPARGDARLDARGRDLDAQLVLRGLGFGLFLRHAAQVGDHDLVPAHGEEHDRVHAGRGRAGHPRGDEEHPDHASEKSRARCGAGPRESAHGDFACVRTRAVRAWGRYL